MAYSKTCKRKRKPNWMQGQLFTLAQMVNENRDIIKGKFGVGITSKTKGDTFLKAHYCQMFLKWLHFKADCRTRSLSKYTPFDVVRKCGRLTHAL